MSDARQLSPIGCTSRRCSAHTAGQQAVLSTMLLGRELGIPAMAALRSVHLIEGKHSLSADLMVALGAQIREWLNTSSWSSPLTRLAHSRRSGRGHRNRNASASPSKMPRKPISCVPHAQGSPPSGTRCRSRCSAPAPSQNWLGSNIPDLLAGLYTPEELRDAKAEVV